MTMTSTNQSKMFFTTSDLLNRINGVLEEIHSNDSEGDGGDGNNGTDAKGQFELQKKMPDGSTRKADENDMALADFQSKLKQAAEMVSKLSPDEKIQWAKEHRKHGNNLFQKKQFKQAMDVYLTCLVAIDSDSNSNGQEEGKEQSNKVFNTDIEWVEKTEHEIKLPVLLNLSACTLKLGMYRKTCSFCDLALEIKAGSNNPKVYFRRGKSRMLLGIYNKARADLQKALDLLDSSCNNDSNTNIVEDVDDAVGREKEAVKKELVKLERLVESAEENRKRQQMAMKRILGGDNGGVAAEIDDIDDSTNTTQVVDNDILELESSQDTISTTRSNHQQRNLNALNTTIKDEDRLYKEETTKKREYSTLKAKQRKKPEVTNGRYSYDPNNTQNSDSFYAWYLKMIERGLRKALYWLGDEEAMNRSFDENEEETSNQRSSQYMKEKQL